MPNVTLKHVKTGGEAFVQQWAHNVVEAAIETWKRLGFEVVSRDDDGTVATTPATTPPPLPSSDTPAADQQAEDNPTPGAPATTKEK